MAWARAPLLLALMLPGGSAEPPSESLLPFDSGTAGGGGWFSKAPSPLRQLLAASPGDGRAVVSTGNITTLYASPGCMQCCGANPDCSHAYMGNSLGHCCVQSPPTCCPFDARCAYDGCMRNTGGSNNHPPGSYRAPATSPFHGGGGGFGAIAALVIFTLLICCLCNLCSKAASSPMGFAPPMGGFAPPMGGFAQPMGGFAPGMGGFAPGMGGFAPAMGPSLYQPSYGQGYGQGGGFGGSGAGMAMAGTGGLLGGLGLGYLLGESRNDGNTYNTYNYGGEGGGGGYGGGDYGGGGGGEQWMPADGDGRSM